MIMKLPWMRHRKGTQRNSSCSSAAVPPHLLPLLPPCLPQLPSTLWNELQLFFYNHSLGWGQLTNGLCTRAPAILVSAWEPICARAWCVSMSGCSCEGGGEKSVVPRGRGGEERRVEEGRNGWRLFNMIIEQPYSLPPVSNPSTPLLLFSSTTADLPWLPLPIVHFKGN